MSGARASSRRSTPKRDRASNASQTGIGFDFPFASTGSASRQSMTCLVARYVVSPLRIVLVRDRRAEERHHRITDVLLHRAAVVLELAPDVLPIRSNECADVLWIHSLRARRET